MPRRLFRNVACCLAACLALAGCQEPPARAAMAPVSQPASTPTPEAPSEAEAASPSEAASTPETASMPETASEAEAASAPETASEAEAAPEPAPLPDLEDPPQGEDWAVVLVNASHPMGQEEAPPQLVPVAEGSPYRVDSRILEPFQQMAAAAQAEGVSLLVCSAYRPYSSQQRNFENSVAAYLAQGYSQEQAVATTAAYIAYPGQSEHQTGLALDIVTPAYQALDSGYADTPAAQWLLENAADYGFTLRYPADKAALTGIQFEPWHYRYVGEQVAAYLMGHGLCLEEYWQLLEENAG